MSRNHRKPGIVRFICTDSYHAEEIAERGAHRVETMMLTPQGLQTRRGRGLKEMRQEDRTARLACSCGRDPQHHLSELSKLALQKFLADPSALRVDIDITTI